MESGWCKIGPGSSLFLWPPIDACMSPAIVIEAGEVYATTTRFFGWPPRANVIPEFSPHAGTHWIRWEEIVSSFQYPTSIGDPIPMDDRLSNEFELVFN